MEPIKNRLRWLKIVRTFPFVSIVRIVHTLPSGCTILRPICRSTVRRGSSHVISALWAISSRHYVNRCQHTYVGNSPLQRATYSFRTKPLTNSADNERAKSAFKGIIIKPDVSLSRRLIAAVIQFISLVLTRHETHCRFLGSRTRYEESPLSCGGNTDQRRVLACVTT